MPCRNANSYRFGEAYCLHFQKQGIYESWIVNQGDEDQFTKYICIVATTNCSATPPQCWCVFGITFSRSYKNYIFITSMADMRVTSEIQIYERRLNSKLYVCSTTLGREMLGAVCVPNKLFLTFLFSNPDVGVQFLKDVGLIRRSMVSCKCRSQMSWCVDTNRKDGYR
jgi:hypothetical protein